MTVIRNDTNPTLFFAPLAVVVKFFFGRLVPAFFILGGLNFLVIGIRQMSQGIASENWPGTLGEIVHSEIRRVNHRDPSSSPEPTYRIKVIYTYMAETTEYTGMRIQSGTLKYGKRSEAEIEQNSCKPGQKVDVFYNPGNPSSAVLVRGTAAGIWIFIGLGSLFTMIGSTMAVFLPNLMNSGNISDLGQFAEPSSNRSERQ